MINLKFYRDDEYVYYNNPNGITKKMTIADFESLMSGESELPAYTSSNQGEVLSVDANGDLEWKALPASELPTYAVGDAGKILTVNNSGTGIEWGEGQGVDYLYPVTVTYNSGTDSYTLDKSYSEILAALDAGKYVIGVGDINGYTGTKWYNTSTNVMYVQLLSYCINRIDVLSPKISAEGIQIAPDGTITYIMV